MEITYKTQPVPLEFEYKGIKYIGEGAPLASSCKNGACYELDITLNGERLGTIHCTEEGWRMIDIEDQGLVDAIGEEVFVWYE